MKKSQSKGFTIVELVIVISVIAILAAVLIPTFSNVIAKANQSAALQTAKSTLTNALTMSSTTQLEGKDSKGNYHTVIVVDGYAFGYTGNQMEAIDYPGTSNAALLASGSTYDSENSVWTKNFNAIAVSLDNLVIEKYTDSEIFTFTSGDHTGESYIKSTLENKGTAQVPNYDLFASPAVGQNVKAKVGDVKSYSLSTSISSVIDVASDFATPAAGKGYVVTADASGNYTVTDGTKTASLYVNSDFSKKVVVFTTFGSTK